MNMIANIMFYCQNNPGEKYRQPPLDIKYKLYYFQTRLSVHDFGGWLK